MFFSDGKLRTEPCLMDGDLHDAGRYQRRRQRQQGGDRRRDVITISMVAMTAQPMGSRNDQSRMDMLIPEPASSHVHGVQGEGFRSKLKNNPMQGDL